MTVKRGEALYAGTILALVSDTDMDEIVCMRIRDEKENYPTITYEEALYSQLLACHVGYMVSTKEITLAQLLSPGHAAVWQQYCKDRQDPKATQLLATRMHAARRLFLHVLEDGSECLVVAQEIDIRFEEPKKIPYWEMGYHYGDYPQCFGSLVFRF